MRVVTCNCLDLQPSERCRPTVCGTEGGFAPNESDHGYTPHASDYAPQDWEVNLSELLRLVQFYNTGGYHPCPEGEDGFCPGL